MRNLDTLTFHPTAEKIVALLCEKTQNTNPKFFRIMVSYYLCKMAASMRVKVLSKDRGKIPVNMYAINLGISGMGKGFSTNIIEDHIINQFHSKFFDVTLPAIADRNLAALANKRAIITEMDPDAMLTLVHKEYESLGKMAFSFDSGTTAAVKQMRHKLLMVGAGAMNLEIDEIGSNLLGNADVLSTFLELFDMGKVKQKLTKNTKENIRSEEIQGKTPTNLLLFGTPQKLFDGSKVEDELWSFVGTGYGRRCFFGYTRTSGKDKTLTAQEVYDRLTDKTASQFLHDLSAKFGGLADEINYDKHITVSKDVSLALIEYKLHCEAIADRLGDHEEYRKAEISHRYFKALKLAGAYAFVDEANSVSEDNLYHAICMAEESGKAFEKMLNQDRNYVKLAKYVSSIGREVTHVDLTESLPFYKGSQSQKNEMMQMAITWGYKNSVVIQREFDGSIEFIKGETLIPTDLDSIFLAYSKDIAVGYQNVQAPFDKLPILMKKDHNHWINHHSSTGRRSSENMLPGCNMIVLDVDGGHTVAEVELLLADYKYLIYTTKRHTALKNRFRVILPLNYQLKVDEEEYGQFMSNLFEWLPFTVDAGTGQRSRKWLTNDKAVIHTGSGKQLLDVMMFIPQTSKNDERRQAYMTHQSLTNIERWFMSNTDPGNRNNQLIRYSLMLVDMGLDQVEIRTKIDTLNDKMANKLSDNEIRNTIMVSVTKAIIKKGGN